MTDSNVETAGLTAEKDAKCRCQIIDWSRDRYEPHIPAQPEWEQADDCPVHPLATAEKDAPCREVCGQVCAELGCAAAQSIPPGGESDD